VARKLDKSLSLPTNYSMEMREDDGSSIQKKRKKHAAAAGKGEQERSAARWSKATSTKGKKTTLSMTNILKQQGAQRLKTLEDNASELRAISIEMEGKTPFGFVRIALRMPT